MVLVLLTRKLLFLPLLAGSIFRHRRFTVLHCKPFTNLYQTIGLAILETEKFKKMGAKRRKSFLAARIALKRLYRHCHAREKNTPADKIETVYQDAPHPRLGGKHPASHWHCSVSHDRRFAIAIANAEPVGVDVEVVSEKALRSARLFMSEAEHDLVQLTDMDDEHAAVRIWSIKEAAAKAIGMNLAESWRRVQVNVAGERESAVSVNGLKTVAHHATVEGHLFTVISFSKAPLF